MKQYKSFSEIEFDLKRLNLERQIAFEELKGIKGDYAESLKPANWLQTAFKYVFKIGSLMLVKKAVT
jgi:hypothetical protein